MLRLLLHEGRVHPAPRLEELAGALGLPLADVLVVGGQPVPGHLLPPDRDREVMRAFTYRVTYCKHRELTALREFLLGLPDERPEQGGAQRLDRPAIRRTPTRSRPSCAA